MFLFAFKLGKRWAEMVRHEVFQIWLVNYAQTEECCPSGSNCHPKPCLPLFRVNEIYRVFTDRK